MLADVGYRFGKGMSVQYCIVGEIVKNVCAVQCAFFDQTTDMLFKSIFAFFSDDNCVYFLSDAD